MDTEELKQEIEKLAANIVHSSNAEPFQKLMAWNALLEIEKANALNKRFEDMMPIILDALKMRERKASGPDEMCDILRTENRQLREHLGQAQNDLRLLAKDVVKQASKVMIQTPALERARLEMLAAQEDVYDLEERVEHVDWQAVYDLRVRAPRHLKCYSGAPMRLDEGCWIYIDQHGGRKSDECHVTALGYLRGDTAAVYQVVEEDEELARAHLYWERRFLYTAQMSKGPQDDLKREMKRRQR